MVDPSLDPIFFGLAGLVFASLMIVAIGLLCYELIRGKQVHESAMSMAIVFLAVAVTSTVALITWVASRPVLQPLDGGRPLSTVSGTPEMTMFIVGTFVMMAMSAVLTLIAWRTSNRKSASYLR